MLQLRKASRPSLGAVFGETEKRGCEESRDGFSGIEAVLLQGIVPGPCGPDRYSCAVQEGVRMGRDLRGVRKGPSETAVPGRIYSQGYDSLREGDVKELAWYSYLLKNG